jgi:hypothetical protein
LGKIYIDNGNSSRSASVVLQPGTMGPLFKVLTIVLLAVGRQGHAFELNKNKGTMFPDQPEQIVNATNNITITCLFIHNTEIHWTLPKLPSDVAVGKKTI